MLTKEKQLVKDAAEFLLTRQIPAFVSSKPAFQKILFKSPTHIIIGVAGVIELELEIKIKNWQVGFRY